MMPFFLLCPRERPPRLSPLNEFVLAFLYLKRLRLQRQLPILPNYWTAITGFSGYAVYSICDEMLADQKPSSCREEELGGMPRARHGEGICAGKS